MGPDSVRLPNWTFIAVAVVAQSISVAHAQNTAARTYGPDPALPAPAPSKVTNFSKAGKWPANASPKARDGFRVNRFAEDLVSARWLYLLPNGDVLVAEASTKPKPLKTEEDKEKQRLLRQAGNVRESADRITLLRDSDGDGVAEHRSVLLSALNQPFGMLYLNGSLYVANTDGVLRFPWDGKQAPILAKGKKILELPAGGYNNHWTRNLIANAAGTKIYVTVGSASNVAEMAWKRSSRQRKHPRDESRWLRRAYLCLRTAQSEWDGLAAGTNVLWTAVNERDNLGENLVPDTSPPSAMEPSTAGPTVTWAITRIPA